MIKGLVMNNVKVIECHETLWLDTNDRVQAIKAGWLNYSLWKRVITTYSSLLKKYRSIDNYDLMIIGYPGQFDVFLGRLLTWIRKKKLVWDVFMSIYLISVERGLEAKNSIGVKLLKWVENIGLRLPDKLIIDTGYYADWFSTTYKISLDRFFLIPTGAEDDKFIPEIFEKNVSNHLNLIYYGTFIPNHGVPYIIESVNILSYVSDQFSVKLIGEGPELEKCKTLVNKYGLTNVEFYPWISQERLKKHIAEADVVLGAFGKTPQSLMTIQNKIYESMAMKKLVISGESAPIREAFVDHEEIILCDRDDPMSLAIEISNILENRDLINLIPERAYLKYIQLYSIKANGIRFVNLLNSIFKDYK